MCCGLANGRCTVPPFPLGLNLSVVPRMRKIWVGSAWRQHLHAFVIAHNVLFLFEQTESINYQFISCLQHMYICTAYWERVKLLLEAPCMRTDRRSTGRSCQHAGVFYLLIVVVGGGNSKLLVAVVWPTSGCCAPYLGAWGTLCSHPREAEIAWE